MDGLLRRAALAVDGGTGHAHGHAGGEPRGAGNVARQRANGVYTAKNHVVVVFCRNAVALHQGLDHMRTQVGAMHGGQ